MRSPTISARVLYEETLRGHEALALRYTQMGREREGFFFGQFKHLQHVGRDVEEKVMEGTRVHILVESSILAQPASGDTSGTDGDESAINLHRFVVPAYSRTMLVANNKQMLGTPFVTASTATMCATSEGAARNYPAMRDFVEIIGHASSRTTPQLANAPWYEEMPNSATCFTGDDAFVGAPTCDYAVDDEVKERARNSIRSISNSNAVPVQPAQMSRKQLTALFNPSEDERMMRLYVDADVVKQISGLEDHNFIDLW